MAPGHRQGTALDYKRERTQRGLPGVEGTQPAEMPAEGSSAFLSLTFLI